MRAIKLVLWSAVAYGTLLVVIRGAFPQNSSQTISLLGIPLLVVAFIIARDLSGRSTSPTLVKNVPPATDLGGNPVAFLSSQIGVAAAASDSYFDNVVRARLRELLIDKVVLETGFDGETVRQWLADRKLAQQVLHDEALYEAITGPVPAAGSEKMKTLNKAIDLIEEWKG